MRLVWQWLQDQKESEIPSVMRTVAETFYKKYMEQVDFAGCEVWKEDHTYDGSRDWKRRKFA
ncbi:hypothetical protein DXB18_09530 [Clostridium sp. OM02-18AC]|nr:hypothetical protein DXB18_09530 [Clostridium sp. OM02-18AC]